MPAKPCSLCGRPADVSFVVLASTLRSTPRRQKSSHSVAYCNSCVGAVINSRTASDETRPHSSLTNALTQCYQALTSNSELTASQEIQKEGLNVQSQATAQSTTSAAPGVSCGPCLIARNSRQNDEVGPDSGARDGSR
jgi:hypothetical protein